MKDRDIVAVHLEDSTITNQVDVVKLVFFGKIPGIMLTRIHMKFMANCDLGKTWTDLAEGPRIIDLEMLEAAAKKKRQTKQFKKLILSRVSTEGAMR